MASPTNMIDFRNSTELDGDRLLAAMRAAVAGWRVGAITVRVRYSRGADFSGTCFYADRRIFINLGRHLKYPYAMRTNLARAVTRGRVWYRPTYVMDLKSGYEVVLFIFLHELYHLLVKISRRNTRQKEAMCDRFAARYLVDHYGLSVRTEQHRPVAREDWDFQDLIRFVGGAREQRAARRPLNAEAKSPHPRSVPKAKPSPKPTTRQLELFAR